MDYKKLESELRRDEGNRLQSYRDTEGNWTIGVGHLLGTYRRVLEITSAESTAWLKSDIQEAVSVATTALELPVEPVEDDVRFRAIVNMAFNLGDGLRGFKKFLAAYMAKDWATAGVEMMDSWWAQQVPARAERLRQMIVEGK